MSKEYYIYYVQKTLGPHDRNRRTIYFGNPGDLKSEREVCVLNSRLDEWTEEMETELRAMVNALRSLQR